MAIDKIELTDDDKDWIEKVTMNGEYINLLIEKINEVIDEINK